MLIATMASNLMNCRFHQPKASLRLFCFPWAGGGSSFYAAWGKRLPANIEVYGITLGGRESRFKDEPCSLAKETVSEIATVISSQFSDKPFILFGHSMGALLSYETAFLLKHKYGLQPAHMYLSGASPHHSENRRKNTRDLSGISDAEFTEHLKILGGTPPEILNNEELMKLFLPALKADYIMVSQMAYERPEDQPPDLSCDFTLFDGVDDDDHDYDSWKQLTSGNFSSFRFPGAHFYLKEEPNLSHILNQIQRDFPADS